MVPTARSRGGRAVVLGGSMAGLLAARVLSERFERVHIVERDELPDGPEPRKGNPQGRHAHVLLARGLAVLERLFPGIAASLIAGGALETDPATSTWFQCGRWKLRVPSGLRVTVQSRPFLEWHVRRRVAALPGVSFLCGRTATELLPGPSGGEVTGVHLSRKGAPDEALSADLVLDASGRGSQAPQWLTALGFDPPREEEVGVGVGYATRLYRRVDRAPDDLLIVYSDPPRTRRQGVLFPLEGDRWICSLVGWLGDHPPADDEGFLAFARTLDAPDLHRAILEAEPLGPIAVHRIPTTRWRHYEQLRRAPRRFLVLGDARCCFNPVYAQGMTVAALEAEVLESCLAEHPPESLGPAFERRVSRVVADAWLLATGEDLRYPEAEGHRPLATPLVNAYVSRVHRRVATDPAVLLAFHRVVNMVARPTALFRPGIALRVLSPSRARDGTGRVLRQRSVPLRSLVTRIKVRVARSGRGV